MSYFKTLILSLTLIVGCVNPFQKEIRNEVETIEGTITVSDQLKNQLKNTDVLYIIARAQQFGPPSAVKRIENPSFPLRYSISAADNMMGHPTDFKVGAAITMAARISRTGNAIGTSGDLEGVFIRNPTKVGDRNVDIVVDRVRP